VYDDVAAALEWAAPADGPVTAAGATQALAIAGALTWFYFTTGRWDDARRAHAAAFAAADRAGVTAPNAAPPAATRRALAAAAYLGRRRGLVGQRLRRGGPALRAGGGSVDALAADPTLAAPCDDANADGRGPGWR
jgi:hypothetical protein